MKKHRGWLTAPLWVPLWAVGIPIIGFGFLFVFLSLLIKEGYKSAVYAFEDTFRM